MNKILKYLTVFLIINTAWAITLSFWFNNVDLSYMKHYFDLANPLSNLSFVNVVRGHVLLQIFSYLLFGFRPFGYYLVAIVLHSLASVLVFLFLGKLFKNNKANFLLAILFGISISYANVLFEGSFNSYYPLILIFIILSIYPFLKYLKNRFPSKTKVSLIVAPGILMTFGLLFRETVLIVPVIIFLIIALSSKNLRSLLKDSIYLIFPVLVAVTYLILRNKFLGELKSDLTDDAVQARMAFISSGRYLEWFLVTIANFLRMLSEQVFPFLRLVSQNLIFTIFGGLLSLISLIFISFRIIKKRNILITRITKFGLGWILFVNLFIAFVLPFPVSVITAKYDIGATISRYNYWGLLGLIILLGAILTTWKNIYRKLVFILALYLVLNFLLIQIAGLGLYKTKHLPVKNFYKTMLAKYPSFPKETVIYYNFFQINNLRDYVGDLTYVFKDKYYPETHFDLETSLSHVEKEYLKGNTSADSIFAFDLDSAGVLVDKTNEARKALRTLQNIYLEPKLKPKIPENIYANFGYLLEFSLRQKGTSNSKSKLCTNGVESLDKVLSSELSDYFSKRQEFLRKVKVSVSSNYGDSSRFYFIDAKNLVDDQFTRESTWQANIGDNDQSIILDLGGIKPVSGVAWYSEGSHALPASYTICTSLDGTVWNEALSVRNESSLSKIEKLSAPVEARYVKMKVLSTSLGQPVRLTEIEALNYSDYILNNYKNWQGLIDDIDNIFCQSHGSEIISNIQPGEVIWLTDKGTVGKRRLNFYLDKDWRRYSVPITNLEIYSNSLAILGEKLKSIEIIPGRLSLDYEVKDVKLVPIRD